MHKSVKDLVYDLLLYLNFTRTVLLVTYFLLPRVSFAFSIIFLCNSFTPSFRLFPSSAAFGTQTYIPTTPFAIY